MGRESAREIEGAGFEALLSLQLQPPQGFGASCVTLKTADSRSRRQRRGESGFIIQMGQDQSGLKLKHFHVSLARWSC